MFVTLVVIGGLAFSDKQSAQLAQGIVLVISTVVNESTLGPGCYPIVSETPSGRLRYKTIAIGRFAYNLTNIFQNAVTPRMFSPTGEPFHSRGFVNRKIISDFLCYLAWNWGGKAGLFYAGTNLLCNVWCWFRLPETKARPFGEIDLLFEHKISARKFKRTKVDRKWRTYDLSSTEGAKQLTHFIRICPSEQLRPQTNR